MRIGVFRLFLVALTPIILVACIDTEAAIAPSTSTAPVLGIDLGNSSRVPQIAGRAGEGEGSGRTEPELMLAHDGSMAGMDHEPGMQMDHGSMAGMDHGSMSGMPMGHGSMTGTDSPAVTASAHGSMSAMQPP